jgi:hypothetical protein
MANEQMSQEDFAVVKLAAAERYRERNIRPETASYLFDRTLCKQAGKDQRGKRDGSGPYKGSAEAQTDGKGKRKAKGEPCPAEEKAAAKQPDMNKITKLAAALKRTIPAEKA